MYKKMMELYFIFELSFAMNIYFMLYYTEVH